MTSTTLLRKAFAALAFSLVAQASSAATLAFWNFENATSSGSISTSQPVSLSFGVTSAIASQTGGGPAENFGGTVGRVHLTRSLGAVNYPYIEFTADRAITLDNLSFVHLHNHNPGFPTNPSYNVQLQLDSGSGYVDIGSPLLLNAANSGTAAAVALNALRLPSGTHRIRWVPRNLASGTDTTSEFFAIDALSLNGNPVPAETPSLNAFALGLVAFLVIGLGAFSLRRRPG